MQKMRDGSKLGTTNKTVSHLTIHVQGISMMLNAVGTRSDTMVDGQQPESYMTTTESESSTTIEIINGQSEDDGEFQSNDDDDN